MKFTIAAILAIHCTDGAIASDGTQREVQQFPPLVNVGSPSDFGNEQYFPLPECWGDCANDSDCQQGLVCCQRNGMDIVVNGCTGDAWQDNTFDFCVQPMFCPNQDTEAPTGAEEPIEAADANQGSINGIEESPQAVGEDTSGSSNSNTTGDNNSAGGTNQGNFTNDDANDSGGVYETPLWNDPNDPWQFLPFCKIPQGQEDHEINNCKGDVKNEEWAKAKYGATQNGVEISYYDRPLEGECGPHCRPTCITLMLDLDDFDHENDLTCNANDMCHCSHNKLFECGTDRLESLFEEHPKCYLENADCLGPTVFDDVIAHAEWQHREIAALDLEHCTSIPDSDLFCRFQEFDLVTPIERYSCEDEDYPHCLNRQRRIYWEFCNIVEEDPFCDSDENCQNGNRCGQDCDKKTEPFPNGWTTFTVTAPIPLDPIGMSGESVPDSNYVCNQELPLASDTKTACFMQRIELYFPPDDEGCGTGCPNCHECPLISLGDKFGPLQVVGFGHCIQRINEGHTCNSCDIADKKSCEKGCELDCDDLFEWGCEESVDCHTTVNIEFLNFEENDCSWRLDKVPNGYVSDMSQANQAQVNAEEPTHIAAIVVPTVVLLVLCCCCVGLFLYRRNHRNAANDKAEDASQPSDTGTLPVSNIGETPSLTTLAFYNNHDRSGVEGDEISVRSTSVSPLKSDSPQARRSSKKSRKRCVDWTGDAE